MVGREAQELAMRARQTLEGEAEEPGLCLAEEHKTAALVVPALSSYGIE